MSVSAIENVASWSAVAVATKTHFLDQFRWRLISQLIKGISRVLQKLLRYFNGTIISTFFVLLFPVPPVIFALRLSNLVVALASLKSTMSLLVAEAGSSMQY